MGRFKIKKTDTFIDMTPMSDVMVLLLTFFMLTATFVKEEPVKVVTPGSVSEIKIPDNNALTIFINSAGKVFISMDSPKSMSKLTDQMKGEGLELTDEETKQFIQVPMFGTPINTISGWLKQENAVRNKILTDDPSAGIPCDSVNNELETWVSAAREACGENMALAIKADKKTPYSVIKRVMNSLRKIDENRYNLITALQSAND